MVDEGEVRKGKTGGSVVCYRGAWLPQVIVDVVHSSCLYAQNSSNILHLSRIKDIIIRGCNQQS